MSCVMGRGYFQEVGGFGSRLYKNNELSEVLRADHSLTLKSAITFKYVPGFGNICYSTWWLIALLNIAVMKVSGLLLDCSTLQKLRRPPKSHRKIQRKFLQ